MLLDGYLQQLIYGVGITIKLACCALVFGMIFGLIGAGGESSRNRWVRYWFFAFGSVIRGVPELIVIFFVYFGGTLILSQVFHRSVQISSFVAGVIALGLIFASYASEVFRGAFLAIPKGQIEAAKALGLNRTQAFRLIKLPQAWRHALPGLGNLWLVLLKDTALLSLIGLADLMMRSQTAAVSTGKPFTFYITAAILYLLLTSISEVIVAYFNARANLHVKHS